MKTENTIKANMLGLFTIRRMYGEGFVKLLCMDDTAPKPEMIKRTGEDHPVWDLGVLVDYAETKGYGTDSFMDIRMIEDGYKADSIQDIPNLVLPVIRRSPFGAASLFFLVTVKPSFNIRRHDVLEYVFMRYLRDNVLQTGAYIATDEDIIQAVKKCRVGSDNWFELVITTKRLRASFASGVGMSTAKVMPQDYEESDFCGGIASVGNVDISFHFTLGAGPVKDLKQFLGDPIKLAASIEAILQPQLNAFGDLPVRIQFEDDYRTSVRTATV
jgi:hypothetical protein